MKKIIFLIAWGSLAAVVLLPSCRKYDTNPSTPLPPPSSINKPPVANAGPYQVIVLPQDSALLDGTQSRDPEGSISSYQWSKISGPASFTIFNANAAQSLVRNLLEGIYKFELIVTDTGGLMAKDTATIDVRLDLGTGVCFQLPLGIVSGPGTITPFGLLSQARSVVPAVAADKVVFGGGYLYNAYSNHVDIYNLSTNAWSNIILSQPVIYSMTAGNKMFFQNPTGYDIYDAASNTWSQFPVDQSIFERGPTVTAEGNKVFFAGGLITNDSASSRIDIYDVAANSWSTATLSEGRTFINTISTGNKIFFVGGYKKWNPIDYPDDPSSRVDIFDMATNTWSMTNLPFPAFGGEAAAIANKVFFTFENIYDRVAIYDISTGNWSTAPLSVSRWLPRPIVVGNKLLLAGDRRQIASGRIDIYDATTNSWTTSELLRPGAVLSFAGIGNKMLMLVNVEGLPSPHWSIFDAAGNTVSALELNYPFNSFPVTINNEVYLGGGTVRISGSNNYHFTCGVWKFQF